ncbi:MAG: phosphoenolpyruvate--protein phosphotransferase [Opitutales bacterium]|nr:phosphoenolpyruvate--protein phosphotransferase [Opitutales bacterium]
MSEVEKQEIRLEGVAASPGLAYAPGFLYQKKEFDIPMYFVEPDRVEKELDRFDGAILETRRQIQQIRSDIASNLGEDEAKIFDAHLMVLEDVALIGETHEEIKKSGYNAEYCFHQTAQKYISFFNNIDDEYLKERVSDIRDVARRLLANLLGRRDITESKLSDLVVGSVLVSKDLVPSDTANLHSCDMAGLVTDSGGTTSHTAIMARSLGLPAVVGLHNISELIHSGDQVLVDGYEGVVIINPSAETQAEYHEYRLRKESVEAVFSSEIYQPGFTLDNKEIPLSLNIEGIHDASKVVELNATEVGLYRTEGVYLRDNKLVSEDAQFEEYKSVMESVEGKSVTFRTFDLGGDKLISAVGFKNKETNPFMGLRAIRYCLRFPDVFRAQLSAILRASAFGNLKIMYPMISGLAELLEANQILDDVKTSLDERCIDYDREIQIGSMIEIPSAAVMTDVIAEHCQFISIGTNDLIQYMMAVDRVNDMISDLYEPYHPAVIRMIKHIVDTAHSKGVPVSVCGEMAGDPIFSSLLLGLGVDNLSVSPSSFAEVKYLIRHLSLEEAKSMSNEALGMTDPVKIYQLLKAFYIEIFRDII